MSFVTVAIEVDPLLIPAIIGKGGEGTKKVIYGVSGYGRKFVECVRGMAYLTAEEDVIDELVKVFEAHVESLTRVFYVKIHQKVLESFYDNFNDIRLGVCELRYCRVKFTPFPHTNIGDLEFKCLTKDYVPLMCMVKDCVNRLHVSANIHTKTLVEIDWDAWCDSHAEFPPLQPIVNEVQKNAEFPPLPPPPPIVNEVQKNAEFNKDMLI